MDMDMDTFPARLRAARDARGLSQLELSRLLSVDPIVVSRYERGKIKPHIDRVETLCEALGVSLDWLLLGRGPSPIASTPAA